MVWRIFSSRISAVAVVDGCRFFCCFYCSGELYVQQPVANRSRKGAQATRQTHTLSSLLLLVCARPQQRDAREERRGGDANTSLSPQPSQTRIIKVGRTGARLSSGRKGKHQARTERERGRKRMESARVLRLAERNPLTLISLTASLLLRAFHFHLHALRALESAWIHFADVAERLCVCVVVPQRKH